MQLPRLAAALFLFGLALDSPALTIGRPQGAVWIGKPLDVVIPLSLDAAEDGGALCLEAEVVQGDTRIADRSLTVSLEPGPKASSPRIHIRSTVAVDEPVVNVNVRAGCDTKSTRSYVLLADVPSEPALPVLAPPSGARASSETPARAPARAPSRAAAGGASSGLEGPTAAPARRSTAAAPAARTRATPTGRRRVPALPLRPRRAGPPRRNRPPHRVRPRRAPSRRSQPLSRGAGPSPVDPGSNSKRWNRFPSRSPASRQARN
ncbi:hypothetical protein LJR290_002508 [Variovorax sp. LjRoot290]|uniref:hypothetical protein n=1 Tax=Variovorax sp. LjRoot290 TaxID=3342316 RepID=UPI003ECFF46F